MTRHDILLQAVAAARRDGLDPALVAAVIEQESSFDPLAFRAEPQLGDASRGLMQLLFGTAAWMGYTGEPDGLFDVQTNLGYGCAFLRYVLHRYGGDVRRALAAYNAGPGNVDTGGWQVARGYVESVLERTARLRAEVEAAEAGTGEPGGRRPYRTFPLEVPYVSQLEPNGLGYDNCGPACVTMALAYNGLAPATRDVMHRVAEEIRGRPWDAGTFTGFAQFETAARRHGIPCRELRSWLEVYGALDGAQPAVLLLDNRRLAPRQYPRGPAFDALHFVVLIGYSDDAFQVADPLSVFTRGPVEYTRASVEAAAADAGGVQAIAIADFDGVPDGRPGGGPGGGAGEEDEMPVIRIADAELKRYLEQLGQGVNMQTAMIQRACLAYRRGETRGPAVSDEYAATSPDGRSVIRQKFTAGIAEYDPATGDVVWVEVVLHPEALMG